MERPLAVRDLCIPVPLSWFDENRHTIEKCATRKKTWLVSTIFFNAVVHTYQKLVASRLLCISVPAGLYKKHTALLGAMRALSKEQFARDFFIHEVPKEIVLEIVRHMDLSSLRAWRRADPHVARLHPCPPVVINWEAVTMQYVDYQRTLPQQTLDFFSCICQAAYVDDAVSVQSMWASRSAHILPNDQICHIRPILAAIARGHSTKVWRSFPYGGITPIYFDYINPATYMLHEALSQGRFGFARNVLGVSTDTLLRTLWTFDSECKGRYEKRERHPVVHMLRGRHFSHVTWFFDKSKERFRELPKTLFDACAAYGHTGILDRWPTVSNSATLPYVIAYGDTADGLHRLERHRPDLFITPIRLARMPIKKTIIKQAIKHGQPEILQWLVEREHLDLINPGDGRKFVDCSVHRKNTRTLAWFDGYMRKQTPVPEWYVKWHAEHKE